MKIRIVDRFASHTGGREDLVVLRRDGWDDFGFKTLFHAEFTPARGETIDLGLVKILKAGQTGGRTQFDNPVFRSLDERYCSLGQDIEYYEKLAQLPPKVRDSFLMAMRDAAVDSAIAREFEHEEGWTTSVTRFGQAEHTLAMASALFKPATIAGGVATLSHQSHELGLNLEFRFDDTRALPGRCKVLIGYNGVGKTRLLAEIARAVSRVGLAAADPKSRASRSFSSVVAVSYSAFDHFQLPPILNANEDDPRHEEASSTTRFGYTYCGLRQVQADPQTTRLKSIRELDDELITAFATACKRDSALLTQVMETIESDPSFGRSGISLSTWVASAGIPAEYPSRLSSGQKIVMNILVQLAAHLRKRSLVLLDEPETHLHPPLLAALLRGVHQLLDAFDSFAVVATHSPVVLQEVAAKDVLVVERFGDIVRAAPPKLETFAAGLGELTTEAFGLDNSISGHRGVIRDLISRMDVEEFERLFVDGASSQARALALRMSRESD
ncbi:AAA family ATPase [Aneurinibacillus sp. BA2021]|nr:AAA family ATPase [Aneurinibacillus sp. BA2021]